MRSISVNYYNPDSTQTGLQRAQTANPEESLNMSESYRTDAYSKIDKNFADVRLGVGVYLYQNVCTVYNLD